MQKRSLKVIPLQELALQDFYVEYISLEELTPGESLYNAGDGRKVNGFLYVQSGACMYHYGNEKLMLKPGALVYLPKGSQHVWRRLQESTSYIRLDFTLVDPKEGVEIVFANKPHLFDMHSSFRTVSLIRELQERTNDPDQQRRLLCTALLYKLFYILVNDSIDPVKMKIRNRIFAGIEYIDQNFQNDFDVDYAAALSNLSTSRFRVLFRAVTGRSVLEYREDLRMERAVIMLKENNYLIKEIADELGYKDAYYFSYCFKKYFGVSPKNFLI